MLDVRPFDVDQASDAEWDELQELRAAAFRLDRPELPVPTRRKTIATLREPQVQAGAQLVWSAHRDGRLVANAIVKLPVDGNEHVAIVHIDVHPALRRGGIGTELFHALEPMLRERGRTRIEGWDVTLGGPGESWARGLGFQLVHATMLQIMELAEVDRQRWEVAVAEGYRLVRWIGAAPADLVEAYATARGAIGDAPYGEAGFVAPDWSVDRVRRIEADYRERGIEYRTVVAVDPHGEVVGLTELESRPGQPERLAQGDTAVLAAHRGHGLGLAMKASMLRWFTADKDEVEQVWTATAVVNTHMAEVNHRLGFETVRRFSVVSREL